MHIVHVECWYFVNIKIEIGIGIRNIKYSLEKVVT